MPIPLVWPDIALRLFCTVVAAGLIGLNRSEHGRVAGLRTSILVALAACLAMVQVNMLLPLSGRMPDSFVMNDLMRLPLGILSGMGFIGAGAIVRREKLVIGVTTAATLWYLTVLGLCFGGGQIALGSAGAALGLLVLWGMKYLEDRLNQDQLAMLVVVTDNSGPPDREIRGILQAAGFRILSCAYAIDRNSRDQKITCELHWRSKPYQESVPDAVRSLGGRNGVVRLSWIPQHR